MPPNALQDHRDYGGADNSQIHGVYVFSSPSRLFPEEYTMPFSQQRCPSPVGSWKSRHAQKLVTSGWRDFNPIPCPARHDPEPEYARMRWLH
ncbi:hypothetical protein BD309DRAFT_964123 [Dichomitus squalens]|nr:hypothetical protein BD309DRAFT_964123 [Dichomitus squalens]